MKIYFSGLYQETNSFCPVMTDMGCFQRGYLLQDDAIRKRLNGTNTELGGFFEAVANYPAPIKTIPGMAAWAVAYGPVLRDTFERLADLIVAPLKDSLPVDGVFLSLHGSLVAEHLDDGEGVILKMVREIVGESTPIVCSLDFHAVVTERMLKNADMLIGYRTYPHVDMGETGRRATKALLKLVTEKFRFDTVFRRVPMILPVDNTETIDGSMFEVMERVKNWEKRPGVFSASAFCTHPWVDLKGHGVALLVYVEKSGHGEIEKELSQLADYIWNGRHKFLRNYPDVDAFMQKINEYEKPIAIVDSGDITTAGGMGDSTVLLRNLLSMEERILSAVPIVDAVTLEKAWSAGEGQTIDCSAGGSNDKDAYNLRVPLTATVMRLCDQPLIIKGTSFSGMKLDIGRRALLQVEDSIFLMVLEFTSMMNDPQFWRSMDLEPNSMDLIVQKSHKLFRAGYADIVKSVVTVDTPGCTDRNLKRLPFSKIDRPIFPMDDVKYWN